MQTIEHACCMQKGLRADLADVQGMPAQAYSLIGSMR
jgi:hypothetical protein